MLVSLGSSWEILSDTVVKFLLFFIARAAVEKTKVSVYTVRKNFPNLKTRRVFLPCLMFGWTFKIKAGNLNYFSSFKTVFSADGHGYIPTCCVNMFLDQIVAKENRLDHCILWCVTGNFLFH